MMANSLQKATALPGMDIFVYEAAAIGCGFGFRYSRSSHFLASLHTTDRMYSSLPFHKCFRTASDAGDLQLGLLGASDLKRLAGDWTGYAPAKLGNDYRMRKSACQGVEVCRFGSGIYS
jgi:hypothetical protein